MSGARILTTTVNKLFPFTCRYPGLLIFTSIILLASGCRQEIVPEPFLPHYAHEAYQYSLEQANLAGTALGYSWKEAGENALKQPVDVTLPFQEEFYPDPAGTDAAGYRFLVLRLQSELLRGGKSRILIREIPSIGFPV